jgi:L-Ala-D/L-Glu epimerase
MNRSLSLAVERFPIAGHFTIARGSRTEAVVVVATIAESGRHGRGECVPYARYGESIESVAAQIEQVRAGIESGADRRTLARLLPPGAARNALDCALWDLEAKLAGVPAHVLAGIDRLSPASTAFTISLAAPDAMAEAARAAADRPILKIKLGAPQGDGKRIAAIRAAVPDATLLIDANEGWTPDNCRENLAACADAGVVLVEQPLREGSEPWLIHNPSPVPLYADESVHGLDSLERLARQGGFSGVNIKLDKAGGLTEALAMVDAAAARGFGIMVGCMVGTSLAMAPAMLLTPRASFVDLDGPLLLAEDRQDRLTYAGSLIMPPRPSLWG